MPTVSLRPSPSEDTVRRWPSQAGREPSPEATPQPLDWDSAPPDCGAWLCEPESVACGCGHADRQAGGCGPSEGRAQGSCALRGSPRPPCWRPAGRLWPGWVFVGGASVQSRVTGQEQSEEPRGWSWWGDRRVDRGGVVTQGEGSPLAHGLQNASQTSTWRGQEGGWTASDLL